MSGRETRYPIGMIELPAPNTPVAPGQIRVAGWALAEDGPLTEALVLVDDRVAIRPHLDWPRPDIAEQHPDVPNAGRAGWEAKVDLSSARGATATVSLLARTVAGDWTEVNRREFPIDWAALGGGRRDRAVFTIVQNEPRFLPLWLRYYGRHFDSGDIYVLDHDSTDGSTEGLSGSCRVIPVHRDKSFDHTWLRSTVEQFQRFLLSSYRYVLFTEVDEIVVADPTRHQGLAGYIEGLDRDAARCSGYEVVHYPEEEPLRFDQPVLGQRGSWHSSEIYSKQVLGRIPLSWSTGFHKESTLPDTAPDPGLRMIHLHRVDYDYCLERHRSAAARDWSESDVREGLAPQNRIVDEDEFRDWFYHRDLGGPREPIPESLRGEL